MRKAFSMIELIFIIVILGILAGAIKMAIPDNRLSSDTNFVLQKIKEKQMYALNYDHFTFGDESWRDTAYDNTCISLDKNSFNTLEENSKSPKKYKLSSLTTITVTQSKVCFDNLARPYKTDYKLNNFLNMPIELNITYKSRTKRLIIMPYSGSVIIKK